MRTRITWQKFTKNVDTHNTLLDVAEGRISSYNEFLEAAWSDECRAEVTKAIEANLPFEEVQKRVTGFLKRVNHQSMS